MGTEMRDTCRHQWGNKSETGLLSRGKIIPTMFMVLLAWLLLSSIGGTSAQAESQSSLGSLIKEVREVSASYEHYVVTNALQSMRVIDGVKEVPVVTVATNDMRNFPSPEHSLYPHYLSKRFSQFAYTVNEDGIVSVDTSTAATDELLGNMVQLAERYQR